MTKEILTVQLGQAGLQMGNAVWELLCLEHNVQTNGESRKDVSEIDDFRENLFEEVNGGKCVPRAILFDMEPTVMDEIRTGCYRSLFNPQYLVNGKEDSGALFARAYYSQGKEFVNLLLDNIRKLVNRCDNLVAFQFINSFAGGTGSGMGALLMEKCAEVYGKKFRFTLSVFPSPRMSQGMVDPYNSILHTSATMEQIDCNVISDNETLYQKCVQKLCCPSPTFTLVNRLYSQMATGVFLSHRFHTYGSQHADVCELLTNLVPYPRIHFPVLAMAPIMAREQLDHEVMDVEQLTDSAFHMESQSCECDIYRNKYISCALLYRGDVSLCRVYTALSALKSSRRVNFVDWCPTGFKLAVNHAAPLAVPGAGYSLPSRSLTMVAGNIGIKDAWSRLGLKYDLLYGKRSFVHHYISEGMEEGEFNDARENISILEKDYTEIGADGDAFETCNEERVVLPESMQPTETEEEVILQDVQPQPSESCLRADKSQSSFRENVSASLTAVDTNTDNANWSRYPYNGNRPYVSKQNVPILQEYNGDGSRNVQNYRNINSNQRGRFPIPSFNVWENEFGHNRSALTRSEDSSAPTLVAHTAATENVSQEVTVVPGSLSITKTSLEVESTPPHPNNTKCNNESILEETCPDTVKTFSMDEGAKNEALEYVRDLLEKSRHLSNRPASTANQVIFQHVEQADTTGKLLSKLTKARLSYGHKGKVSEVSATETHAEPMERRATRSIYHIKRSQPSLSFSTITHNSPGNQAQNMPNRVRLSHKCNQNNKNNNARFLNGLMDPSATSSLSQDASETQLFSCNNTLPCDTTVRRTRDHHDCCGTSTAPGDYHDCSHYAGRNTQNRSKRCPHKTRSKCHTRPHRAENEIRPRSHERHLRELYGEDIRQSRECPCCPPHNSFVSRPHLRHSTDAPSNAPTTCKIVFT